MAKHSHTDPAAKPAVDQQKNDPHGLGEHADGVTDEAKSLPHGDREASETAPLQKRRPEKGEEAAGGGPAG